MKRHELVELVVNEIKNARSIRNLTELVGLKSSGGNNKAIKEIIELNSLDISHFGIKIIREKKYKEIEKKCIVCENKFITKLGHKKEQTYCSKSCSNKDRIVSEETKEKLRESVLKNSKIKILIEKYGENVIGTARDMRLDNKTYEEILNITKISEDDLKILFNFYNMNRPSNNLNALLLKKDTVIKLYLEYKNLKKVAKILGVSYTSIRKFIDDDDLIIRKLEKTGSQSVIDWRKRKKIELVEYKGGKCEKCGYDKSISALQFHHLDPKEKDFTISGKSYSFERLKKEVDKCIMVCANCHIEIHEELKKKENVL